LDEDVEERGVGVGAGAEGLPDAVDSGLACDVEGDELVDPKELDGGLDEDDEEVEGEEEGEDAAGLGGRSVFLVLGRQVVLRAKGEDGAEMLRWLRFGEIIRDSTTAYGLRSK
jgi:hypothetical protein